MTTQVICNAPGNRIDGNAGPPGTLTGGAAPVVFIASVAYVTDTHPLLPYYNRTPGYSVFTGATAPGSYATAVAAMLADRGQSGMVSGPLMDGNGNVPNYPRFP